MKVIVFFSGIIFICLAFLSSIPGQTYDVFSIYLYIGYRFLQQQWLWLLFSSIAGSFYFMYTRREKEYGWLKRFYFSFFYVWAAILLGWVLAFVLLCIVAWVQLTIFSILVDINPGIVGIETSKEKILSALKENGEMQIIASDTDSYHQLVAIASATTGRDTYYGRYILPAIPGYVIFPRRDLDTSLLLMDDTLIVTRVDPIDIKTFSPVIGRMFLKRYFWRRAIKGYPQVRLMTPQEYIVFREKENTNSIAAIDTSLTQLTHDVASTSAFVQNTKETLAFTNDLIQIGPKRQQDAYKSCLANRPKQASSSAIKGCRDLFTKWTNDIEKAKQDKTTLEEQIATAQEQLHSFADYQSIFTTQKAILQSRKGNIGSEVAFFEPKDQIRMILTTKDAAEVVNYLELFTHEYLHYASYTSEDKKLADGFFEEGLTEYFARNSIESNLRLKTNLGYPAQVKIIAEMAKRIPDSDLADIYFAKDNVALEKTLDSVYGDGFYKRNRLLLATIQYTANSKQLLKLSNEFMKEIGGQPLTEKDLLSTLENEVVPPVE